ncbi:PcaH Protocatechuate 3,4-dioxygenase beta subunit [Rhabdaerophilaceae bacterium]
MSDWQPPNQFRPWPEGVQPAVPIEGYPNTWTFTPARAAFPRPQTLTEATGPVELWRKLPCGDNNLAVLVPGRMALGQFMRVSGRILAEDSRPIPGAIVELWQANAAGRYAHSHDDSKAPVDPDFLGHGRVFSDEDGRYTFFTIKPGAYPVPVKDAWWRPPHVHFSVVGPSSLSRLVTQMYFPGDPLNEWDRILNSIQNPAARARLVARQIHPSEAGDVFLAYYFDIVLRGALATPEA